jgi:hypothetical protein
VLYFAQKLPCPMTAQVLSDANAVRTRAPLDDWDLYIPRYGGRFSRDMSALLPSRTDQWIAGIPGTWRMTNKAALWSGLCRIAGRERAGQLTPESWRLDWEADRALLIAQHEPGQTYILKNPKLQRRTGLQLTRDLDAMLTASESGFTIAQRVLPDLQLIAGHRYNLRLYLLLIRRDGQLGVWLNRRGRCVCTPEPFTGDLMVESAVITRSASSDGLAPGLPFTLSDVLMSLPDPQATLARLDSVLSRIVLVMLTGLEGDWSLSTNPAYQLLGVDATVSESGTVRVIEMNSGPDLRPHCERDRALKYRMVRDIFEHVDLLAATGPPGFRHLRTFPDQATVGDSTRGRTSTSRPS